MRLSERRAKGSSYELRKSVYWYCAWGRWLSPKGVSLKFMVQKVQVRQQLLFMLWLKRRKKVELLTFIDAEHALDPAYAATLGVNIDELLLSQPDSGEQGLEIAGKLIDSGAVDLVVVDSAATLVPRAEIDGDIGDSHVGLQARMMSQAMRKLSASINKTKTIAIFINQLREKVGVMFGNPETTPGGLLSSMHLFVWMSAEIRRSKVLVIKKIKTLVRKPRSRLWRIR